MSPVISRRSVVIFIMVFGCWRSSTALDNALARTPPMGWNSWATYELKIDEGLIRATADAMVSSGMKGAGYEYIIVDAGWKAKSRDAEGRLKANPDKFPS